jgi:YD repeat-containing protein
VGTTVFSTNALGEQEWQAQGVSGGTNTNCTSDASSTDKVLFSYDNQGGLRAINYGDTSPDVAYTRSNDGDILTLVSGTATQTYRYDSRHLLEHESLNIDGKTFALEYGYDEAGALSSLTYPNSNKVQYTQRFWTADPSL